VLLCRPAALAESVFDGVKAKMRNLKAALAAKENMLQGLVQVSQPGGSSSSSVASWALLGRAGGLCGARHIVARVCGLKHLAWMI
jgi:hypothetical protein